jgi:peptidoglycan LD-endopeptidase CwlK
MNVKLFGEDTLFLRRFLQGAGFYNDKLNSIHNEKTDAAINAFEERTMEILADLGNFDSRSEKSISSLHPKAQQAARVFIKKVLSAGIDTRIISGTRTYAEQNELFYFKDKPHYQLATGLILASVRDKFENGQAVV